MNTTSLKKYIIAGVLVIAVAAYFIFTNKDSSSPVALPSSPSTTTTTNSTASDNSSTTTTTVHGSSTATTGAGTTPESTSTSEGEYKDGTYTGSVADAFYGKLQAVAVIKGGAIVDVQFPEYPTEGHSGDISNDALPILKQEAIASQSAQVNVVSGATQDSQAFEESLAVALSQAKN